MAPPVVGGAGAAGGGASTGVPAGMKAPALGAVGATGGGVPAGGPACGLPAPDSIALIAPDEIPCAPAPAGCPVAMPEANDCARFGGAPCPKPAAGTEPPADTPDIPEAIDPPPPGNETPVEAAGGPIDDGPPANPPDPSGGGPWAIAPGPPPGVLPVPLNPPAASGAGCGSWLLAADTFDGPMPRPPELSRPPVKSPWLIGRGGKALPVSKPF